jgi:hypothetical protein
VSWGGGGVCANATPSASMTLAIPTIHAQRALVMFDRFMVKLPRSGRPPASAMRCVRKYFSTTSTNPSGKLLL